jgi:hypothetical protein
MVRLLCFKNFLNGIYLICLFVLRSQANLNGTFATLFVIYVILVIVHFDLKLDSAAHHTLLSCLTVFSSADRPS